MNALGHNAVWTDRDKQLLDALTRKVRQFTLAQVAAIWWGTSKHQIASARARLRLLARARLIEKYSVTTHPILRLVVPEVTWAPGVRSPDCKAVAARLQGRWTQPSQSMVIYVASKLAANLFAGSAMRFRDMLQIAHDIHLSQVFVHYASANSDAAKYWVGEDELGKSGYQIKDPDAYWVNANGVPQRVIEFGGRYETKHVHAFHKHCEERQLPYEIW